MHPRLFLAAFLFPFLFGNAQAYDAKQLLLQPPDEDAGSEPIPLPFASSGWTATPTEGFAYLEWSPEGIGEYIFATGQQSRSATWNRPTPLYSETSVQLDFVLRSENLNNPLSPDRGALDIRIQRDAGETLAALAIYALPGGDSYFRLAAGEGFNSAFKGSAAYPSQALQPETEYQVALRVDLETLEAHLRITPKSPGPTEPGAATPEIIDFRLTPPDGTPKPFSIRGLAVFSATFGSESASFTLTNPSLIIQ